MRCELVSRRFRPGRGRRALVRQLAALAACAALLGCATPTPAPPQLFADARFGAATERVDGLDVFAPSDAMQRYLDGPIREQLWSEGAAEGLLHALYRRDELQLDYDAAQTRDAAHTFAARKGNCLSLVIMTAAFAKALQLDVSYQVVTTDDTWSRSGDLVFLSKHVNITLKRKPPMDRHTYETEASMTVDFLPGRDLAALPRHEVSERTIVAMYMNNRAAESLVQGELDQAYWWARGAVREAPQETMPYNTLGVVYLRHGDVDLAESVLRYVLARDARDTRALGNLAVVLERKGRIEDAAQVRARLAELEPYPPYHFFLLGMEAMRRGDYREARTEFGKEVERADYSSEFHFWLGLADLRLGDVDEARKQIRLAMASSTRSADRDLYAAKLERLRTYAAPH